MSMITGKSVVINGGYYNQNNYADDYWQKLYEHVAKGALYDSQERSRDVDLQVVDDIVNIWNARFRSTSSISAVADPKLSDLLAVEDVIKDILIWLHDPFTRSSAMWLYDDKKACTSLVAHVVAKILSQRKELSAAYFFPGSPAPDIHTIVPTIAYQLGRKRPAVKSYIAKTLEDDIAILHSNLHKQMKMLVINPLTHSPEPPGEFPQVILIHALEDFEVEFQNVLDKLIKALASIENCPTATAQRLLIIGRPTPELQEYFLKLPERSILQRPINNKNRQSREEDDISRGQEALRRVGEMEAQAKQVQENLEQLEKAMEKRKQEVEEQERIVEKRLEKAKRQEANLQREEEKLQQRAEEIVKRRQYLRSEEENLKKPAQGVGADSERIAVGKQGLQLGFVKFFNHWHVIFGRRDEPTCIAVIGQTGSGKTHFVNCLKQGKLCKDLGNDMLLVSPVKMDSPELGRSFILIDTPGRDPWNLSWSNILTMLNDWLTDQKMHEKQKVFRLSGILYLHPIACTDDTSFFYPPPLEKIEKIFGKKVAENVLSVTTMWDKRVDEDQHKQMEMTFQTWKRVDYHRMDRFDNTTATAWRLIDRLLTGN